MATKTSAVLIVGLTLLLAGALAAQQKPDDIPDAPSADAPDTAARATQPRQQADEDSKPNAPPADNSGEGVTTGSKELPHSAAEPVYDKSATPPPMPPVTTVPAGSVPRDEETGEDLYKIRVTNQPGAGSGYRERRRGTVGRRLASPKIFRFWKRPKADL